MTHATQPLPRHVGFIIDGNRRWARDHNLPTLEGHKRGAENLKAVAKHAFDLGVEFVSAYVFSTENWKRTQEEVDYLMKLTLKFALNDTKELHKENIKIVILGSEESVPTNVLKELRKVEEESRNNTRGTLAVCFNYGAQQEIVDAFKNIMAAGIGPDSLTPEVVGENLYHPEVPPLDYMIRTSGEQRISNFMLWRMAYTELYFTNKHWPDFDTIEFEKALEEYKIRNRRFGGN